MNKKTLLGILLFAVIATSVYGYMYKGHRDIDEERADYVVTIAVLKKEFMSNESLAYKKYQDKIIELTAKVSSIDAESNGIVLDQKVFATFKDSLPLEIASGKTLKIKGRFLGYDELLQEFKIDQSSIVH
jgi:hypothetical protein